MTFIGGRTNEPSAPVGVGTEPNGIAIGLGSVGVADEDGSLYRLDPVTLLPSAFTIGTPLTGVTVDPDDGLVWVTTGEAG